MSFDWLNVPGLTITDDSQSSVIASSPPPNVSFGFPSKEAAQDEPSRSQAKPPSAQSISQSSNLNPLRAYNTNIHPDVSGSTTDFHSGNISADDGNGPIHSHSESDIASSYAETPQELRVPLAVPKFQLSKEERKAYARWYRDLRDRVKARAISLDDVFHFLSNFRINDATRDRIHHIFRTCKFSITEDQFYAIVRLISRALHSNLLPTRSMIIEQAPLLRPKSILSANAGQEVYEEVEEDPKAANNKKVDFDGFASLLLTGQSMRKNIRRRIMKRKDQIKRVRFSQNLVSFANDVDSENTKVTQTEPRITNSSSNAGHLDTDKGTSDDSSLDLSLPMDQLLAKLSSRKNDNSALVKELPSNQQPETQEEKEVLEDMKDSLSHFSQIQKVDGVTQLQATRYNPTDTQSEPDDEHIAILKPTATGSANHLFRQTVPISQHSQNSGQILEPLKPTGTGSANAIFKNIFKKQQNEHHPDPTHLPNYPTSSQQTNAVHFSEPLQPTSTGSANYMVRQQHQEDPQEMQEFRPFQSAVPSGQQLHAPQRQQSQQPQQQTYLSPQPSNNAFERPSSQGNYLQANNTGYISSPQPNMPMNNYYPSQRASSPSFFSPPSASPLPPNMPSNYSHPTNYMQQQQHPNFNRVVSYPVGQSSLHPPGSQLVVPSNPNFAPFQSNSPKPDMHGSDNILNDLKALQQQVDQLHMTYSYNERR